MKTLKYLMWLHLKNNIITSKAAKLFSIFGTIEKIYEADKAMYLECGFGHPSLIKELLDKNLHPAEAEIEKAKSLGITLLGYGMKGYPSILTEIENPPMILYVLGDPSVLQRRNAFCIVGTRESTVYGMSATLGISEQLARCGMVIVSGVALGIDSAAHRGAVRGGGKTIGIMGCGLDVDYPAGNEEVRKAIMKNGALISEFPLGTPPFPGNFPIRNRLLSGFSLGVAVIEGGKRSGALITAKHALEQGRDVYALPGNITNPMSAGTNQLIADGAALLTGADDILAEYLVRYPEYFEIQACFEDVQSEEPAPEEITSLSQNSAATAEEKRLLHVITKEPMHVNEMVRLTSLPIHMVQSMLTMLQIKGKIKEHPGKRFSIL